MNTKNASGYFIGLMSGTSMDGIDAALIHIDQHTIELVHHHEHNYPSSLKKQLNELCNSNHSSILQLGELNRKVGTVFSAAALELLKASAQQASDIIAIGSHGQTIYHHPNADLAFSMQLGDPNSIAFETQITTVADFRNKDMVAGGQGAPLVPRFHQHLLQDKHTNRVIINIGGISNITVLNKDRTTPCLGFDTGPGNTLLDAWIHLQQGKPYDIDGAWSRSGSVNQKLLNEMLADRYFSAPIPKSTGREYFNLKWLNSHLSNHPNILPKDVQRTLIALTAHTIYMGIESCDLDGGKAYVCGGGCHNSMLMEEIERMFNGFSIDTTKALGVDPDWMEAMAFAWFASRTLSHQPSNLPSATGACKEVVLGGIYYP